MYRKGHYGVALLVFAPVGAALLALGAPTLALVFGGTMLWLAMLPDVDRRLPLLPHRGPTHSLLFALLVGAAFGIGGYVVGGAATLASALSGGALPGGPLAQVRFAVLGFALGAVTVLAHLLADALTPAGVKFLWPLSGRSYSLGLTRADSAVWNYGLLALGACVAAAALYVAATF